MMMTKIDKNEQKGLTQEKKMMFKSIIGKASSPKIDLNKIRDEWKHTEN